MRNITARTFRPRTSPATSRSSIARSAPGCGRRPSSLAGERVLVKIEQAPLRSPDLLLQARDLDLEANHAQSIGQLGRDTAVERGLGRRDRAVDDGARPRGTCSG